MIELTMLALHGNGSGAFQFEPMRQFMPESIEFRPLTLPGFDGKPLHPELKTVRDYAGALQLYIEAAARPRVLLATGSGCAIAMQVVQQFEDEIDALVLHSPVDARLRNSQVVRLLRVPGIADVVRRMIALRPLRPLLRRVLFERRMPDKTIARFFEGYARCQAFPQVFRMVTTHWYEQLRPVSVPSALLWGERQPLLTDAQINDYRRLLPNQIVRIVPDWNRFAMIEHPAQFAQVVVDVTAQLLEDAPATSHVG